MSLVASEKVYYAKISEYIEKQEGIVQIYSIKELPETFRKVS